LCSAKHLGVAVSTVSKAIKNSPEISQETKERILEYVEKINYVPNKLAVNLQRQKTMTIGIIVPELVHHFFSRVISGAENHATRYGFKLLISLSNDEWEKERQVTEMLTSGYVDGLIVSVAKQSFEKNNFEHFNRLIHKKFPIVFFDRSPQELPVNKVIIDDIEGGYKATKHLIEKGGENIAILTTPPHINVGADREKGYRKALNENNLTINENLILRIDERQAVRTQIEQLFENKPVPDAVFAVNEQYAAIVIKVALERNIKIPDELMIIGFTDGFISKAITPSLSTMAQHGFEMGEKAMDILLEKIENGQMFDNQKTAVIPINLVERESTKK